MGVDPPFIYDKPSSYTFAGPTNRGFDPKAATRASWSPPAPKPKRDGPLINFNQHPDSYLIVPYGNLNAVPMNPNTKNRVKRSRKLQLFLRILGLIGALGLLFCVIAINKTSGSTGWIIRVGPAVALCHCVYAIHHLCRDAAGRPAASTASYMLFAALVDTGLIPFFAFSAVMANADYQYNAYGWGTLFQDATLSSKIIYAFFLTCVAEGGLMVISLIIDIYLAKTFRKISQLPPDMNPLEDNLTARPNPKHKRNKSELHFEKHLSGSTLATERLSQITNGSQSNFKRVPYVHTRTDSADSITLYGNERALNSRTSLRNEIKENTAASFRHSAASSRDGPYLSRPTSAITPAANARAPGAGLDNKPIRSSGLAQDESNSPASWLSYTDRKGTPSILSKTANQQLDNEIRPLSPVSMISDQDYIADRTQAERINWYTNSPHHTPQKTQQQLLLAHDNVSTDSVEQIYSNNAHLAPPAHRSPARKRSRDPLGMNPPTPIQDRFQDENADCEPMPLMVTPQRPALYDVQPNSSGRPGMNSRPSSFIGSGGKARYYGDLRNSLGGSPTRETFGEPTRHSFDSLTEHSQIMVGDDNDSGNFKVYDSDEEDEDLELEDHQLQLHMQQNEQHFADLRRQADSIMLGIPDQDKWNGTRKVSNSTGYDLKTGYAGLGAEFGKGMARRREVSGKVAEEGRGGVDAGYGGIGASEMKDGGVVTGQAVRGGAAGWARFHGL